jgi:hypothetical protein
MPSRGIVIEADAFRELFGYQGIPIDRSNSVALEGRVVDPTAREILIEFGIPQQLGDDLFFRDLGDECTTLGDEIGDDEGIVRAGVERCIIMGSGSQAGVIAFDGSNGRVFSWKDGVATLVSTHLARFLESICLIQAKINQLEEAEEFLDEEQLSGVVEQFLTELREIDEGAPAASGEYWDALARGIF